MNQSTRFNIDYFIRLTEKIAVKYNITEKEAELIIRSQFDFVKQEMGDFKCFNTIKLKHLGRWKANPYRVELYRKWNNDEENTTSNGGLLEPGLKEPGNQKNQITNNS